MSYVAFVPKALIYDYVLSPDEKLVKDVEIIARILSESIGEVSDILDVGCGTGRYVLQLYKKLKEVYGRPVRIVGIDTDNEMINVAARRLQELGEVENITFARRDVKTMTEEEAYDVVIVWGSTINYMKDEEELVEVIKRIYNLLRPGGLILIETFDAFKLLSELWPARPRIHAKDLPKTLGGKVIIIEDWGFDSSEQRFKVMYTIMYSVGGKVVIDSYEETLLPITMFDLKMVLKFVGFTNVQVRRGYTSERMIVYASKRS